VRRPIRNQILFPFLAVVSLALAALSGITALQAARKGEEHARRQLSTVVDTLAHTSVPYTDAVLNKMRGLSGAHFIAWSDEQGTAAASTLPAGVQLPPVTVSAQAELPTLDTLPVMRLGSEEFLVARIQTHGRSPAQSLIVLYPRGNWSRARWDDALPPLLVGAGAILVTAAVSFGIARRFSRRLQVLESRVARIAGGDFTAIPIGERNDEIRDLAESVNRMCSQLQQMARTIRQTERTRLLGQFAGGLAHQLRNAVTGAKLSLQVHQRRCAAPAADESLAVAKRQLTLMETQIKGLLSLGRAESRERVPVELSALAADVRSLVGPACEHARVRLVCRVDDSLHVHAEAEALQAALLNLVLNALEAAGSGGTVWLDIHQSNGQVCIDVRDTGTGPPAELAATLFEPFVTGKPEGIGLGLALARQVAADHAGSLAWFRADGCTCFRLQLPPFDVLDRLPERQGDEAAADHSLAARAIP
jgi:signal transduction histidine kinase